MVDYGDESRYFKILVGTESSKVIVISPCTTFE